jgi:hypothetical protein
VTSPYTPQTPYGSQPAPQDVRRPGSVTTAAITLIVFGVLTALFSVLIFLAGAVVMGSPDAPELAPLGTMAGAAGGIVIAIAAIMLLWGILEVVAGINVLSRREWARFTGMILGIIGALFSLLIVVGTLTGGGSGLEGGADAASAVTGAVIFLVFLVGYVFVVWALIASGRWFSRV